MQELIQAVTETPETERAETERAETERAETEAPKTERAERPAEGPPGQKGCCLEWGSSSSLNMPSSLNTSSSLNTPCHLHLASPAASRSAGLRDSFSSWDSRDSWDRSDRAREPEIHAVASHVSDGRVSDCRVSDCRVQLEADTPHPRSYPSRLHPSHFSVTDLGVTETPDEVAEEQSASVEVVAALRRQLQGMERTHLPRDRRCVTSGFQILDQVLPQGGLEAGSLVEWLSGGPGCGTLPLALQMARQVCGEDGLLVIVDRSKRFYPPALEAWGFSLQRLLWVRPESVEDERWAVDQALRCSGASAVWCSMGALDSRWLRRFQLAAESGGTLGLLERPLSAQGQPSWADLQIVSRPQHRPRPHSSPQSRPLLQRHSLGVWGASQRSGEARDDEVWRLELEITRGHGLTRGLVWEVEMDLGLGELKEHHRQSGTGERRSGSQGREDESQPSVVYRSSTNDSSVFKSTQRPPVAGDRFNDTCEQVRGPKALPVRLVSQLAHPAPRRRSARA